MAFVENRRAFRVSDTLVIGYHVLNHDGLEKVLDQLRHSTGCDKTLFPVAQADQAPINVNISTNGLTFETNENVPAGRSLALTLVLPLSAQTIYAVGSVSSCKPNAKENAYRLGVKFTEIPQEGQKLLSAHIDKKLEALMGKTLSEAITEKRRFVRIDDFMVINYALMDQRELASETGLHKKTLQINKSLFPAISVSQPLVIVNISAGGVAFRVNDGLVVGSPLAISIFLSTVKKTIFAMGKVASCVKIADEDCYRVGIKFTDISKSDHQLLKKHLNSRSS